MGILSDMDLENIPETGAVAEGEYEVRIVEASDYVSKRSGKAMIRVILLIEEEADSDLIYHYIVPPTSEDDERTTNNKRRRIEAFLNAFGISQDDEYPDWEGKKAWALLGVEEDPQSGATRNTVKRFIEGN